MEGQAEASKSVIGKDAVAADKTRVCYIILVEHEHEARPSTMTAEFE